MERFNHYRDRGLNTEHLGILVRLGRDILTVGYVAGSGIAPFLPVPLQPAPQCCPLPVRALLFIVRFPLFLFLCASYFLVLQWLPIGSLGKKAALWCILGVPSIWWVDLQVDGVRKG